MAPDKGDVQPPASVADLPHEPLAVGGEIREGLLVADVLAVALQAAELLGVDLARVEFAEVLLEKVDAGDFIAGVVGQNIVLEGLAFSVFEGAFRNSSSRPMKNDWKSLGNRSLRNTRSPVPQVSTWRPNQALP